MKAQSIKLYRIKMISQEEASESILEQTIVTTTGFYHLMIIFEKITYLT